MVSPVSPSAWPHGHPVVPFIHILIGDVDDPVDEFERIAADDLQPFGATVVWMFAAFGVLAIDDVDAAVALGRRGGRRTPISSSTTGAPAHLALGAALVVRGDVDDGLQVVAWAMPRDLASGTRIFLPLVHLRVAEGLGRRRTPRRGRRPDGARPAAWPRSAPSGGWSRSCWRPRPSSTSPVTAGPMTSPTACVAPRRSPPVRAPVRSPAASPPTPAGSARLRSPTDAAAGAWRGGPATPRRKRRCPQRLRSSRCAARSWRCGSRRSGSRRT